MEDVIAICQEEENMLDLIQSIGRQIPIQNLPKITEALKNRYPNLLTQLVKIVLERADAAVVEGFTIEQPHLFDLVCDFGSEEDGRALMKRIFQSQNLPQDKLSHLMLRLKVCTLYICTGPSLDPHGPLNGICENRSLFDIFSKLCIISFPHKLTHTDWKSQ